MKKLFVSVMCGVLLASGAYAQTLEELRAEVAATENAFAQTMADRDFEAFKSFLAPDTVFWGGGRPQRGADAVATAWQGSFEGSDAPFSWKSETVLINDGGKIAFSTGPVSRPNGEVYAYFNSVWRKNDDGQWKVIFDKGVTLNRE